MNPVSDRRYMSRLQIPDAKVACRQKSVLWLLDKYAIPLPLKDISRSGASFAINIDISVGYVAKLRLIFPHESQFTVKGEIVWISQFPVGAETYAGVQFLPFGEGPKYNTFTTHEKLERIILKYQ